MAATDPKQIFVQQQFQSRISIEFMYVSITNFVKLLLIALAWMAVPVSASDECTFSEVGILDNIERVASAHAGASVDAEGHRASWSLSDGTVEYFEAGGCYDYGEAAGRSTKMAGPRKAEAVLKVAVALARKFMAEQNLERVIEAIDDGAIERVKTDGSDTQFISHPFGEIIISHSFTDGVDTVEIAWPVY